MCVQTTLIERDGMVSPLPTQPARIRSNPASLHSSSVRTAVDGAAADHDPALRQRPRGLCRLGRHAPRRAKSAPHDRPRRPGPQPARPAQAQGTRQLYPMRRPGPPRKGSWLCAPPLLRSKQLLAGPRYNVSTNRLIMASADRPTREENKAAIMTSLAKLVAASVVRCPALSLPCPKALSKDALIPVRLRRGDKKNDSTGRPTLHRCRFSRPAATRSGPSSRRSGADCRAKPARLPHRRRLPPSQSERPAGPQPR